MDGDERIRRLQVGAGRDRPIVYRAYKGEILDQEGYERKVRGERIADLRGQAGRVFEKLETPDGRYELAARLQYGAGLRLSEVVRLRVAASAMRCRSLAAIRA